MPADKATKTVSEVVIETQRLVLCRLSVADAGFVLGLLNEPSFLQNIGDKGVRSAAEARQFILTGPMASYARYGHGLYRVDLAEVGEPIGICGLLRRDGLDDPDVGFAFLPRFWSRGYASEAAAAAMAHGRETLGLERLVAITSPDNAGSQRVLEKLGFTFDKLIKLSPEASAVKLFTSDVC